MSYRADIDGLRAIAVLSVLLFHCGIAGITGGYVGVDIFFVISGFVIAQTLKRDLDDGLFSFRRFYERRVRRLFPALIFVFTLSWVAAWYLFLPEDFDDFSKSLAAASAFVSNLYFWRSSGYFNNDAFLKPLLHTWSLSVEEQFYIIAPAVMYVCYRYLKQRFLLVLVPAIVLSLGLSIYASDVAPTANFFNLPTRAWELLLGVTVAVGRLPALSQNLRNLAAALGAALIAYAVFGYTKYTPFPGATAIPPCLGAALIIWAGSSGSTVIGRALSLKPVVAIGLISYSLYLVHWPLLVFTRYATLREPGSLEIAAILLASFALAAFSWRFIEQPFRHPTAQSSPMLWRGFGAMAVACLVGAIGTVTSSAAWRPAVETADAGGRPNSWKTGQCFLLSEDDPLSWKFAGCTVAPNTGAKVLLWGDSYAAHYAPGLAASKDNIPFEIIQYTAGGCPPVLSYFSYARPWCQAFNRRALDIIREHQIKTVVLSALWVDVQQRGLDSLQSTLNELKSMGVEAWVIGQSPVFPAKVPLIARKDSHAAAKTEFWPPALDDGINARLREAAAGAHFIDPLKFLCSGAECRYRSNGHLLYWDNGHFTDEGSLLAVQSYFPLLTRKQATRLPAE